MLATRRGWAACSDHSAQVPTSQVSQAYQASGSGTQGPPLGGALPPVTPGENHGIASGNPALDAVLLGVQQLQALQAQNLSSTKKADAPEQVKTGITAFPKLAPPRHVGKSAIETNEQSQKLMKSKFS